MDAAPGRGYNVPRVVFHFAPPVVPVPGRPNHIPVIARTRRPAVKPPRRLGRLSLVAACVACGAVAPAEPPAAANAVRITKEEQKDGVVLLSGTFTTADGIKLDRVAVSFLPVGGGRVVEFTTREVIDHQNQRWGPVPLPGVPAGHYRVWVEGDFSDRTSISTPLQLRVTGAGDPPPAAVTLGWRAGFPNNDDGPHTISAAGTYEGRTDVKKPGYLCAVPDQGGVAVRSELTLDWPTPGRWSAIVTGLPEGKYNLIAVLTGADGNRYCAPHATDVALTPKMYQATRRFIPRPKSGP